MLHYKKGKAGDHQDATNSHHAVHDAVHDAVSPFMMAHADGVKQALLWLSHGVWE
eukprot:gene12020-20286_t